MLRHRVEEFGPFRRAAGIGHVAADQHKIERVSGMDGRDARHDPRQAIVAAWAATSAFDENRIVRRLHECPTGGR